VDRVAADACAVAVVAASDPGPVTSRARWCILVRTPRHRGGVAGTGVRRQRRSWRRAWTLPTSATVGVVGSRVSRRRPTVAWRCGGGWHRSATA